jgi:hypothetical protein
MYFTLLLSVLTLTTSGGRGTLSLEASSPQTTVLIGEPLKVVVHWRAEGAPVPVVFPTRGFPDWGVHDDGTVEFVIHDSLGVRSYREHGDPGPDIPALTLVRLGEVQVRNFELVYGRHDYLAEESVACRGIGSCTVQVLYSRLSTAATSNALRFDVVPPKGVDTEVYGSIAQDPHVLAAECNGGGAVLRHCSTARELIARYPTSPYFRWATIAIAAQRFYSVLNMRDPDTGEHMVRHRSNEEQVAWRGMEEEKIAESLLGTDMGPLDEERLDIVRRLVANEEQAKALKAELLAKYPDSASALRIKTEERPQDDRDR